MASHVEERGRLWNSGVRVVHYETCDVDREWWIVDAYDYTSTVQQFTRMVTITDIVELIYGILVYCNIDSWQWWLL